MKAVDTNILVRLIVQDHAAQLSIASALVTRGIFIPLTVLLELGWLLRSRYGFDRARIASSILELIDNPSVHIGDEAAVRSALALFADGADFADAMHLVAARGTEAFVTFDQKMASGETIGIDVEIMG